MNTRPSEIVVPRARSGFAAAWLGLLSLAAACSSSSSPSTFSGPMRQDAAVPIDPTCTQQDTRTDREALPSGACTVEGATCKFYLYDPNLCGPSFASTWYGCSCTDHAWTCDIIGGGFGSSECEDASSEDAADATDATDASDASADAPDD